MVERFNPHSPIRLYAMHIDELGIKFSGAIKKEPFTRLAANVRRLLAGPALPSRAGQYWDGLAVELSRQSNNPAQILSACVASKLRKRIRIRISDIRGRRTCLFITAEQQPASSSDLCQYIFLNAHYQLSQS